MTHKEYSERYIKRTHERPCASWHITFGGRCLNCGYDPEREDNEKERESSKKKD
jgi:hypothetical protein